MKAKRGRRITRLEAFSDGVFAFSATLLVVSLEVPRTFPELLADLKGFGGFALSFAALILIWSVHNGFFRRFDLEDNVTIALNGLLLFVVLFYVYPLKFMATGIMAGFFGAADGGIRSSITGPAELGQLFVLYGAGFMAIFLCMMLLYRRALALRVPLELDEQEIFEARFFSRHYGLYALVGLLSVLAALSGVGLRYGAPGWVYFLIGPLTFTHARISYRGRE